jgi:hypothetical protein
MVIVVVSMSRDGGRNGGHVVSTGVGAGLSLGARRSSGVFPAYCTDSGVELRTIALVTVAG